MVIDWRAALSAERAAAQVLISEISAWQARRQARAIDVDEEQQQRPADPVENERVGKFVERWVKLAEKAFVEGTVKANHVTKRDADTVCDGCSFLLTATRQNNFTDTNKEILKCECGKPAVRGCLNVPSNKYTCRACRESKGNVTS
jgi:hypothetical protein